MKLSLWVVLLGVWVLAACAPAQPSPFSLADSKWVLVSVSKGNTRQTPALPNVPTLELARSGRVSGTAGCNRFEGAYQTQGEIVKFTELATTLMACSPAEVMELESNYLDALRAAQLYERRADQLTITYADGKGKLVFRPM